MVTSFEADTFLNCLVVERLLSRIVEQDHKQYHLHFEQTKLTRQTPDHPARTPTPSNNVFL